MQRSARLIARLSPGEKLLLLGLRRQDALGEADLLRTLLRQEAVRRDELGRATEEIREALRLIAEEEPKTVGRPPTVREEEEACGE